MSIKYHERGSTMGMAQAVRARQREQPLSKGGFTPIAVDAVTAAPLPRSSRLGVRLAVISTVAALGPVGAALAWGWSGRLAAAVATTVAVVATCALTAWAM